MLCQLRPSQYMVIQVINFVDYSRLRTKIKVHQLIEHQSIGHTPARHESNGAIAGDGANFTMISSFQSTCDFHHNFGDFSFILLTFFICFFFLVHILSYLLIQFQLILVFLQFCFLLFSFIFVTVVTSCVCHIGYETVEEDL